MMRGNEISVCYVPFLTTSWQVKYWEHETSLFWYRHDIAPHIGGEDIVASEGRTQCVSVYSGALENIAQLWHINGQTPRIEAVPRLPRPVSGPSRTSTGGTTICEKYPWYLSKLHKAPPLHRGQDPHRQQRFMMQQRLRQGLGPTNGWEIPSHYWLSTSWGLDAVSAFCVRNVRHQTGLQRP